MIFTGVTVDVFCPKICLRRLFSVMNVRNYLNIFCYLIVLDTEHCALDLRYAFSLEKLEFYHLVILNIESLSIFNNTFFYHFCSFLLNLVLMKFLIDSISSLHDNMPTHQAHSQYCKNKQQYDQLNANFLTWVHSSGSVWQFMFEICKCKKRPNLVPIWRR